MARGTLTGEVKAFRAKRALTSRSRLACDPKKPGHAAGKEFTDLASAAQCCGMEQCRDGEVRRRASRTERSSSREA